MAETSAGITPKNGCFYYGKIDAITAGITSEEMIFRLLLKGLSDCWSKS
jgi:hypothetical protein